MRTTNKAPGSIAANQGLKNWTPQKYAKLTYPIPDVDFAIALLQYIPERPDYNEWIYCISAIGNTYAETNAMYILSRRFKDEKPGETLYYIRHRIPGLNFGVVVNLAKKYGWESKLSFDSCRRHPGIGINRTHFGQLTSRDSGRISFSDVDMQLCHRFDDENLEERAAILQFEAGLSRYESEQAIIANEPCAVSQRVYRCSINKSVQNKTTDYLSLTSNFQNTICTVDQIAGMVKRGFALCACVLKEDAAGSTRRCNASWQGSEIVALDIDSGLTIEQCLSMPLTRTAILLYTTASHKWNAHRYRLLFALPHFETNASRYRVIVTAFIEHYGADPARKDLAPAFFGNTAAEVYVLVSGEVLK